MTTPTNQASNDDVKREVIRAIARLKAGVLALVFGLIAGVALFAMTAILIIEDGPDTGAHLRLLNNYFIGYAVTWKGAFIGFLWASVVGALIGWWIGIIYNRVVGIRTNVTKR